MGDPGEGPLFEALCPLTLEGGERDMEDREVSGGMEGLQFTSSVPALANWLNTELQTSENWDSRRLNGQGIVQDTLNLTDINTSLLDSASIQNGDVLVAVKNTHNWEVCVDKGGEKIRKKTITENVFTATVCNFEQHGTIVEFDLEVNYDIVLVSN